MSQEEANKKTIVECFTKKETVRISYYSETTDQRVKEREIDVYGHNNRYFGGYCHLRNDVRNFRFDRVIEALATGKKFSVKPALLTKLIADGYIADSQEATTRSFASGHRFGKSSPIKQTPNLARQNLNSINLDVETSDSEFSRIIQYYVSCIEAENYKSKSLRSSGDQEKKISDFIEREELIALGKEKVGPLEETDLTNKFFTPGLLDGKEGNVFYGYPVLVNPLGDMFPLFQVLVRPIRLPEGLILQRESEDILNHYFLEKILDLTEEETKVAVLEIEEELKIRASFQERIDYLLDCFGLEKVFINPELLHPFPEKPGNRPTLINQTVLYTSSPSIYTASLLQEIKLLRNKKIETSIKKTSLNYLLRLPNLSKNREQEKTLQPLIHIVPSNYSQDKAIDTSLSSEWNVITGPPGTGKSQIVVNLIANLVFRGETVLFSSKNNKAVDVVIERLTEYLGKGFFVRTGSWEHRKSAIENLKRPKQTLDYLSSNSISQSEYDHQEKIFLEADRKFRDLEITVNNIKKSESLMEGIIPEQIAKFIEKPNEVFLSNERIYFLLGEKARLLEGKFFWYEKIFNLFSKKYLGKKIEVIEQQMDGTWGEKINGWLFDVNLSQLQEKLLGIWLFFETSKQIEELKKIRDNSEPLDILKYNLEIEQKNLFKATQGLISHILLEQSGILENQTESIIREFADSMEKAYWSSTAPGTAIELLKNAKTKFPKVLKGFPVWITTNLSTEKSIPFSPGVFDYLIIDEASQCDIPSALPLMYRAKKIIILGDPFQLKHICSLTTQQDQFLLGKAKAIHLWQSMSYRDVSFYDLGERRARESGREIHWLLDHYRSRREIIGFSNDRFYQNRLVIIPKENPLPEGIPFGIQWDEISFSDGSDKTNLAEIDWIEKRIQSIRNHPLGEKFSVGVVTPFRRQANLLDERLGSLGVVVGTAHRFQGDEKDIIFFSTVINPKTGDRTLGWINKTENLVNVAVTRARQGLIVVGSAQECMRLEGILKDLARYVQYQGLREAGRKTEEMLQSPAERTLYYALTARGLRPVPQYPSEGCLIDLALIGGSKKFAIEVDGKLYHQGAEKGQADDEREERLRHSGWRVLRFTGKQIYHEIETIADEILRLYRE